MNNGTPQDEYGHVTAHIIHYANARFKQLTLFIALSAGLIGLLFYQNNVEDKYVRFALKILGIVTTSVFWVLEQSSNRWWARFVKRAAKLEKTLGYGCFQKKPLPSPLWCNATRACRYLFVIAIVFWEIALLFRL